MCRPIVIWEPNPFAWHGRSDVGETCRVLDDDVRDYCDRDGSDEIAYDSDFVLDFVAATIASLDCFAAWRVAAIFLHTYYTTRLINIYVL